VLTYLVIFKFLCDFKFGIFVVYHIISVYKYVFLQFLAGNILVFKAKSLLVNYHAEFIYKLLHFVEFNKIN